MSLAKRGAIHVAFSTFVSNLMLAFSDTATPRDAGPHGFLSSEDDTLFPTRHVTEVVKALHPKDTYNAWM